MIAYNKTLLENTFLVEEAIRLKESGFITPENLDKIKSKQESLNTHRTIFVRIGFFFLGTLLYNSILAVLFLLSMAEIDFVIQGFLQTMIGIGILELLSRRGFFRHGLDDAFIIGSQISFYITVSYIGDSPIPCFISMIVLGFILATRYVNTVSAIVSSMGMVFLLGYVIVEHTSFASTLPFILLALAIGFYCAHQKFKDHPKLYLYEDVLQWFFIFALFLGYFSINYFVVRTLSEEVLAADYTKSGMPLGWIFNVLMFAVPLGYVVYSLREKNRTMLYIGTFTFVLSICTYRYYHSILPTEWALLLGGLLLFMGVYLVIQRIKNNATGITFQHDRTRDTAMLNNVEALIVNSQDLKHAEETQQSKMPFGGGGFSGGGSGGSF